MADEQEAIAPIEQASPAIETSNSPKDEPEALPATLEEEPEQLAEAEPEEIETIEIDWDDGKKYVIPKALEGGILKNKDYTQKTQTVSEKVKALESREAEIEQRLTATDEELRERATLINVESQLEQYGKVDWDALEAQDPAGANRHWRIYQTLKGQHGELSNAIQQKAGERSVKAQQDTAKRIMETVEYAKANIPGWKPELDKQIVDFAVSEDVPRDFLSKNMSPTLYKLLHKAFVGHQTLTKQAVPKALSQTVVPLKTVGGKSTPTSSADLASADMDAYIAARKKGVGGKPLR